MLILDEFALHSWMYVEEPTKEELAQLVSEQHLDPWLVEDAIDLQEVPRVEVEKDIIYIFTRFVHEGDDAIETVPMLLILKEDGLIMICPKPFARIHKFMEEKIEFATDQRLTLLTKIFKEVDDTYNDYLNTISKKIRGHTIKIDKIKNKDIIQFVYFENILYDFNTSLVRIHTIYSNLLEGKVLKMTDLEHALIEDILQENTQLIEIAKENAQTIVNIRDAYSTIMTNNLNRVIKLFTALTVILTIPTIIGAFYGMNVKLPYADNPLVFQDLVVGTLVVCLLVVAIFYYKDWL
ncbi:MAG: magnesium transporter CorA family protein [Candidatus Levybacteria bacterium]|nr:magnesium transporter CorA family protein [Candidatus Levybacteria bacterium]